MTGRRPFLRRRSCVGGKLVARPLGPCGKRVLAMLTKGPAPIEAMPHRCGIQTLKTLSDRGLVRITIEITDAGRDRVSG